MLIILLTFSPPFLPHFRSLPLSPQSSLLPFGSHNPWLPHFLSLRPPPLSPSPIPPASSGGCPCRCGGLHREGHPEQPVPAERRVLGCHLPTRHNTVWWHQGRRGPRSGEGGLGHGGCSQGEAPAEDGKWEDEMYIWWFSVSHRILWDYGGWTSHPLGGSGGILFILCKILHNIKSMPHTIFLPNMK